MRSPAHAQHGRLSRGETVKQKKNKHAVALGRLGGLARTPKKAAAVKRNGAKGGRPRKVAS